jgi:phosphatidylserine synthase
MRIPSSLRHISCSQGLQSRVGGSGNYCLPKSISPLIFTNKVLLEHSCDYSSKYWLWLLCTILIFCAIVRIETTWFADSKTFTTQDFIVECTEMSLFLLFFLGGGISTSWLLILKLAIYNLYRKQIL